MPFLDKIQKSRSVCREAVYTGSVHVLVRFQTTAYVDINRVACDTIAEIGHTNTEYGFSAERNNSWYCPRGWPTWKFVEMQINIHWFDYWSTVSCFVCGGWNRRTHAITTLPPQVVVWQDRKSGEISYLRPDAKSQVTVEYDENDPPRPVLIQWLVSTQHDQMSAMNKSTKMINKVIKEVIPASYLDEGTKFFHQPTGRFCRWASRTYAWQVARSLLIPTVVIHVTVCAFSGKDATMDCSASYAARYIFQEYRGSRSC